MKHTALSTPLAALLLAVAPLARAWHDEGHAYAAIAAVEALPDDVPAFFRDAADQVAQGAIDPDVFKHRATPQLDRAEAPEHYIDLELTAGRALPEDRYAYLAMLRELDVDPHAAGFLPYAITEWTQRLTLAFAEHRADPTDEHARMKAIVYAGLLSHYAADLAQPLHCTIHWDGRANPDGSSPHTGIHLKVDALPTHLPFNVIFPEPVEPIELPRSPKDVMRVVINEAVGNGVLVESLYKLEPHLPDARAFQIDHPDVKTLTIHCMRRAARITAALYLAAWQHSADLDLPWWLDRPAFTQDHLDRDAIPKQPTPPGSD